VSTARKTVAVLGPGAVGIALAVPLARAGQSVVCIARTETAAAIRSKGLTLRRDSEALTADVQAVEELREPVDVLLITVKAPDLGEALGRIRAAAATVVPLLNGLEHVDTIRERLGGRVIAASIGRLEAYRESATEIVQTTLSPIITVACEDGVGELLRAAGFEVKQGDSERAVLWEKLARLAPLAAATAISQQALGELRRDADWRATLEAGIEEACEVAAADGVALDVRAQWEILDTMPSTLTTSTARDAGAGRQTELDAILGAVVRAGRRLGVATPTLENLYAEAEDACRTRSL
jgi:2-dehydropantoate 2-reductase